LGHSAAHDSSLAHLSTTAPFSPAVEGVCEQTFSTVNLSGSVNSTVNTAGSAAGSVLSGMGISDLGSDANENAISELGSDANNHGGECCKEGNAVMNESNINESNSNDDSMKNVNDGKSNIIINENGHDAKNVSNTSQNSISGINNTDMKNSPRRAENNGSLNDSSSGINNISSILADNRNISTSLSSSDDYVESFIDNLGKGAAAASPRCQEHGGKDALNNSYNRNNNPNEFNENNIRNPFGLGLSRNPSAGSVATLLELETTSLDASSASPTKSNIKSLGKRNINAATKDTSVNKQVGKADSDSVSTTDSEKSKEKDSDMLMVCVSFGVRRWAEW
jgi:hypothetical protein